MQYPTIQRMKDMAERVQARTIEAHLIKDGFRYAAALTAEKKGRTLAAPGFSRSEYQELQVIAQEHGLQMLEPPLHRHSNDIYTSITRVDWGIAETGSLVIDSTDEDLRIATMLAEIHVALLPVSRIVPEAGLLEAELSGAFRHGAAYWAFITGPSRTADIERVLAIGVHGPQELHIVLTEES